MTIQIDTAGYIVLVAALILVAAFVIAVFYGVRYGSQSQAAIAWVEKVGITVQLLGISLACSATTMPVPPLIIFLVVGICLFFFGRYIKQEAVNTKPER